MQRLHPEIVAELAGYEQACKDLVAHTQQVQRACSHERIAEAKWRGSDYGSAQYPRRICLACGLEEEGSYWSGGTNWRIEGSGKALLENAPHRDVLQVTRDEFYEFRIPLLPVHQFGLKEPPHDNPE